MLSYELPNANQTLMISDKVIQHLGKHRQLKFWQKEAGGQLFARIKEGKIGIIKATGPRRLDWRSRFSFRAHRPSEQEEIQHLFESGLHYIGDWHTHPEKIPKPSQMDIKSFYETFRLSKHGLAGMVFLIVGQEAAPQGLHLTICDGVALQELKPRILQTSS